MGMSRRTAIGLLSAAALVGSFGAVSAQETIKIGLTAPLTGPAAEIGHLQTEGAKLGVEKVNAAGGVLGKKFELVIEDDQTTNPGIVLAFSRLISRGDLAAVLASVRSTQVNAISGDAKKAGIPVFFGGTDPTLTHSGNPWLFRARPNDSYSAKVIADFGVNQLKKKKWAVLHSTDAFGTNGAKALVESLKTLGIEPVLVQGFNNGQSDLTPVVLAVRQSGADIIATYTAFENDVAVLARQLKQFGVTATWVGSASVASTTAMQLAGPALYGTYAVADFNADANPIAKAYFEEFSKKVGRAPDYTSAWAYDSVLLLAEAIKKAGSTDPAKIRDAILAIKDFPGTEGTYTFDENGDGLRGYNIVKNENGKIIFDRHIAFDK
ncbi:ABC transporter substrate-binding protein [Xanthobacter sp. VTT E-85241]|uniref:ABC transporter substrate-binding protein n=1 Tax=Roseixanthobacter finlandensis TaxID=3119922 RepID=UPI00372A0E3E